ALLEHACFAAGQTCHGVVESKELAERAEQLSHQPTRLAASVDGRLRERVSSVELDGRLYEVKALIPEPPFAELARRRRERSGRGQIVGWYARNVQVANAAVATDSAKSSARCRPTEFQSVPGRTTSRAAITPQLTGLNFAASCIQCGI